MTQTGKVVVGAVTDFLLTGLIAVLAVGHFPDAWGWFVAIGGALIAAIKHVRGMLLDPKVLVLLLLLPGLAFAQGGASQVLTVDAVAGVTSCELERSTDNGVTWAAQTPKVTPAGTPSVCVFLVQTPPNGRALYRWAYFFGTTRILRTDAGLYTCVGLADCPLTPSPINVGVR